jgi:hypothetical protein
LGLWEDLAGGAEDVGATLHSGGVSVFVAGTCQKVRMMWRTIQEYPSCLVYSLLSFATIFATALVLIILWARYAVVTVVCRRYADVC